MVTLALTAVAAGTASILIYTTPFWLMLIELMRPGPTRPRKGPALLSALGCGTILLCAGQPEVWGALSLILLAAVM